MTRLAGKAAIVTGASKGIGGAIARALAAEGAAVIVNYASDKAGADTTVAAIVEAGGRARAVQADVATAGGAKALADAAIVEFGRLDILVNNSGIYEFAPVEDITEEHYRRQFDVNVLGTLLATQAAAAHLGDGGSVINISSNITSVLMPGSAVYSGTKAAVDAITVVLARELGPRGIRVNAILPGATETEGTHATGLIGSPMIDGIVAQTPLGRLGQPDDIAKVAVFLASDEAAWITAERLAASGGVR